MKSPIHILLLDDDPMSNLINEKIFQFSGYDLKISSFVDAKEALNFLRTIIKFEDEKFPDIIFADINMNGMSGWEFIDELSDFPEIFLRNCTVYMLTSSIDQGDIKKAETYEIIKDIISKPLTEEIVVRNISKIIFHN